MKYIIVLIMFFVSFATVNAQVVINEIAWMGSDNGGTAGQNANDEWIELYNNGNEAVDLSEWSLNADDGSPSIALEGMINAGEFFLLERSDDNSVPSVIADLIYTGALSNSGETLRIKDNGGVVIDTIDGTEGWQSIGGNNETKETAQRVSSGWITTSPTPGSSNESSGGGQESQSGGGSSESTPSGSPPAPKGSSFPVEQRIFANAGKDKTVIVGADSLFEGKSLGLKKEPLANARYVWNFGNGEIKEGQNVLHYYQYPGEYVVMLNVSSGEFSTSDRITVNAFPAELAISKVEKDFIEISNKSKQELNLSWWQLQSLNERFMIPKDTIILPNKKLIFSSDVTNLDTSVRENISLLYPNGVEAVSFFQIKIPQKTVVTKTIAVQPIITKADPPQEKELEKQNEESQKDTTQTASAISSLGEQDKDSGVYKWLFAIFGIVVVSAGAVVFMGKGKKEDEIEIIE